jgi:hypothetical protein
MISQVVVTRSTAPQEVELVDDAPRSGRAMKRTAKQLRKQGILPPQNQVSVSSGGLYLPVFPTEEAKWLTHNIRKTTDAKDLAQIAGVMLGAPVVGLSVIFGGFIANDWVNVGIVNAFGLLAIGPAIVYSQLPISKVSISHRTRMVDIAYESFSEWAKNRYGITVSRDSLKFDAECIIVSGHYSGQTSAYVKDENTGDSYQVVINADNQIYLARWDALKAEAAPTLEASISPLTVETVDVTVVLPEGAADLHKQLMASVALLKTQELSVEAAHQVERTVNAVNTVITKYAAMAKLKTREKTERELVGFLRNQIAFIDGMIEQQADDLGKEISVEIAAVTAAEKNSLLLEVKR